MLLALQIALGMFSGVIFFSLLHRAFFSERRIEGENWFQAVDVVMALSLSLLFGYLAWGLFNAPEKPYTEKDIPASMLTQLIFGGAMLGYVSLRKISMSAFFGTDQRPFWKSLRLGCLLMLGIFPFIGILANLLNSEPSHEQEAVKFFQTTKSVEAKFMLAFMAVIVAPIVEEIVFRGLLYRIFKGYFGNISAMFFTSVLFASIHGNLPTLLPLTLLAFGLTAGLELTGSLLVSIVMHATFNAVSLLLILTTGSS